MSIALVVTRGFGNGTLTGSITDLVLAGYGIGVVVDTADSFYASSGVINANALATIGMIIEEGGASTSLITDTFSSSGKIDDNAISSTGIIDPEGSASKGDI